MAQSKIQGHRRAHGNAADHGPRNLQVIHQGQQIIGKGRDADFFSRARRGGSARGRGNQRKSIRKPAGGLKSPNGWLTSPRQSVLEEKRHAAAGVLVMKVDAVPLRKLGGNRKARGPRALRHFFAQEGGAFVHFGFRQAVHDRAGRQNRWCAAAANNAPTAAFLFPGATYSILPASRKSLAWARTMSPPNKIEGFGQNILAFSRHRRDERGWMRP